MNGQADQDGGSTIAAALEPLDVRVYPARGGGGCVVEASATAAATYLILNWPRPMDSRAARRLCEAILTALASTDQTADSIDKYSLHGVLEAWPTLGHEQRLSFVVYARRKLGLDDFGDGLWAVDTEEAPRDDPRPQAPDYHHFRMIDSTRLLTATRASGGFVVEWTAIPAGPRLRVGLPFSIGAFAAQRVRLAMMAALIEQDGIEWMPDRSILSALIELWPRLEPHTKAAVCAIAREDCGYDETGEPLAPSG